MRLNQRHKQAAVVPTSSMADIAFLLIVFFMVTITFEKDKTQVTLPKTELRNEIAKDAAYISLTTNGAIRVTDGDKMSTPMDIQDVVSFASDLVATKGNDHPVVIKADAEVPYEKVDAIMDSLKQAKVKQIYLLSEQKTVNRDSPGGQP
jgi:biopolymer transport protein ExbD